MKKFLFTIIILLVVVTLSVNFVRYMVFVSTDNANMTFTDVDVFSVMDVVSQLDWSTDRLFADLLESIETLGSAGSKFVSGFTGFSTMTGSFFDRVLNFLSSIVNGVIGLIEFVVSGVQVSISFFVWVVNVLRSLYDMLNLLLGTSFGT